MTAQLNCAVFILPLLTSHYYFGLHIKIAPTISSVKRLLNLALKLFYNAANCYATQDMRIA
jgi:hypothetical protein